LSREVTPLKDPGIPLLGGITLSRALQPSGVENTVSITDNLIDSQLRQASYPRAFGGGSPQIQSIAVQKATGTVTRTAMAVPGVAGDVPPAKTAPFSAFRVFELAVNTACTGRTFTA
jgi:hypothetical protein